MKLWVSVCLLIGSTASGQGVISSATPEATAAGAEIMKAGGNAVDAAVAVAFTLGVTEPAGSGVFGQTFLLIHPPDKKPFVINGTSYAPIKLPTKLAPVHIPGRRATTVPSTVRVLDFAFRKYGSGKVTWKQVLEPAIRCAEEGYKLGHFRHRSLMRYASRLLQDKQTTKMYLPNGKSTIPPAGTVMKLPQLAKALRRLAEHGADDFYKGQIAEDIAEDMKKNKGWITLQDLKSFPQPKVVEPLHDRYRGHDVYTLPPPTGGWVVLLSLNILERAKKGQLAVEGSDSRVVWLAETLRVGHSQRADAPISNFQQYAKQVGDKIDDGTVDKLIKRMNLPKPRTSGGETTHFSLVDPDGMTVAVTASINAYFGAQVAHPKWGFLYNDYMNEFVINQAKSPYNLKPRGMPYSSMSGTILARNGKPVLAVGSPGSQRIISAVVQVISHHVDVGKGIKAAVAAPRLHVVPDADLFLEGRGGRIPAAQLLKLELRGYNVLRPLTSLYRGNLNPYFGGVHAVAKEKTGWEGGADPRRDGVVEKVTQK